MYIRVDTDSFQPLAFLNADLFINSTFLLYLFEGFFQFSFFKHILWTLINECSQLWTWKSFLLSSVDHLWLVFLTGFFPICLYFSHVFGHLYCYLEQSLLFASLLLLSCPRGRTQGQTEASRFIAALFHEWHGTGTKAWRLGRAEARGPRNLCKRHSRQSPAEAPPSHEICETAALTTPQHRPWGGTWDPVFTDRCRQWFLWY